MKLTENNDGEITVSKLTTVKLLLTANRYLVLEITVLKVVAVR